MNLRTLLWRGLWFHRRSHLGVVLGAAVATTVLVGALVVGDSVRWSLRRMALVRLGRTETALAAPERFFRSALADDLAARLAAPAAPVLQVAGVVARADGVTRVADAQIVGVDARFWKMGGTEPLLADDAGATAVVNRRAARALGVGPGDELRLRFGKPGGLSLDAPLSGEAQPSAAPTVTVAAVATDEQFGRFSLAANQVPPYNVFVPLGWLQRQIERDGRANVLLVGRGEGQGPPGPTQAQDALAAAWQPADAELSARPLPAGGVEIRSDRVFIDTPIAKGYAKQPSDAVGILTYFVNELRVGDRATPYSMVSAIGYLHPRAGESRPALGLVPVDMADDEIIINKWLADDLAAKRGDTLTLSYYVPGPAGGLEVTKSHFRVREVIALEGPAADKTLMPDFPGLTEVEDCRDWHPGPPLDNQTLRKTIRDEDQAYWKANGGTPKALVTLAAGRRMWANRFGDLTAIRFPPGQAPGGLAGVLEPKELGLYFQPVRERAMAAGSEAQDFGQLFLGLSFFLIVAALVLTGLLFAFGVEQRAEETGTLLALGFTPGRVRNLMLAEGLTLAILGGAVGMCAAQVYTKVVLWGLATVWQGAVGSSDIAYHASSNTPLVGAGVGIVVALAAMWLTLRRQARAPARELLAAGADAELRVFLHRRARPWFGLATGTACAVGAVVLLVAMRSATGEAQAGVFFGAGALLLLAGLAFCQAVLARMAASSAGHSRTAGGLGLRNATRRRGRSLATISLVAFGAFLVVAVGANRRPPPADPGIAASGTGGFRLFGQTTLPIHYDLLSKDGLRQYALPEDLPRQVKTIIPMRVHEGDDASCLNLNRVRKPRLAGVRPAALAERESFTFAETIGDTAGANPWTLLARRDEPDVVPAIGDAATIQWSLGKKVGDEMDYIDGRGRPFRLRIVAAVAGSILQGMLVVDEEALLARFPSEGGYRMLLIDVPAENAEAVSRVLSRQLADVGLALVPTADRLTEFNSMQNTYLGIFQTLGGLGLLLGSAGLGVVVLRNVLERRGELALMRAVGFRRRSIEWMVLVEHWGLLVLGLGCGVAAAVLAVAPAIRSAGAAVPYVSLAATLAAVGASGVLWTWLAARLALRGRLLEALRNE